MSIEAPEVFSRRWWLVITITTLVVGVIALLALVLFTDYALWQLVLVWLVITMIGDAAMAIVMQAVAPVRVIVGPGDRRFNTDGSKETAVVVSGFEGSSYGAVRVRGETWSARRETAAPVHLEIGARVRVLQREGLTLVVTDDARRQGEAHDEK